MAEGVQMSSGCRRTTSFVYALRMLRQLGGNLNLLGAVDGLQVHGARDFSMVSARAVSPAHGAIQE